MKGADKHYKFINGETGYVIFYHSLSNMLRDDEIKAELEKTKMMIAVKNKIFNETIYWQEIREE